jgi:hypothetical protein
MQGREDGQRLIWALARRVRSRLCHPERVFCAKDLCTHWQRMHSRSVHRSFGPQTRGLPDDKPLRISKIVGFLYSPDALEVGCSTGAAGSSAGCTLCRTSAPCTQKMTSSAMLVA